MTATLASIGAPEWTEVPARLGADWAGSILVGGDRADAVAAAYRAAGARPVVAERPDLALLTSANLTLADAAQVDATGLPDGSVSLVTLRRAWRNGATLDRATAEAFRILRPGGRVIVADLAVDDLLTRPPHRYPAQLVYRQLPGAAERLGSGVSLVDLPVRVMAARFKDVTSEDVDETLGRFPAPSGFAAHLRAWAGDRLIGFERGAVEAALENAVPLVARFIPRGDVVDREPWRVVSGVKPG